MITAPARDQARRPDPEEVSFTRPCRAVDISLARMPVSKRFNDPGRAAHLGSAAPGRHQPSPTTARVRGSRCESHVRACRPVLRGTRRAARGPDPVSRPGTGSVPGRLSVFAVVTEIVMLPSGEVHRSCHPARPGRAGPRCPSWTSPAAPRTGHLRTCTTATAAPATHPRHHLHPALTVELRLAARTFTV